MNKIFGFFLRLLAAFLVSKIILGALAVDTAAGLLGLAVALVMGSYFLERWGPKIDWVVARILISMNQLPSRREPKNPAGE
jgi:thiol:disulfide interchange protein